MINQYIELLTELSNLLHWHLSSSQEAPLTLPWGFVVTLHSFSLLLEDAKGTILVSGQLQLRTLFRVPRASAYLNLTLYH